MKDPGIFSSPVLKNCRNPRKWVPRFLRLGRYELTYHDNADDPETRWSVQLSALERVEYHFEVKAPHPFVFLLKISTWAGRDIKFCCQTEEMTKRWIDKINFQRNLAWNSIASKAFDEVRKSKLTPLAALSKGITLAKELAPIPSVLPNKSRTISTDVMFGGSGDKSGTGSGNGNGSSGNGSNNVSAGQSANTSGNLPKTGSKNAFSPILSAKELNALSPTEDVTGVGGVNPDVLRYSLRALTIEPPLNQLKDDSPSVADAQQPIFNMTAPVIVETPSDMSPSAANYPDDNKQEPQSSGMLSPTGMFSPPPPRSPNGDRNAPGKRFVYQNFSTSSATSPGLPKRISVGISRHYSREYYNEDYHSGHGSDSYYGRSRAYGRD